MSGGNAAIIASPTPRAATAASTRRREFLTIRKTTASNATHPPRDCVARIPPRNKSPSARPAIRGRARRLCATSQSVIGNMTTKSSARSLGSPKMLPAAPNTRPRVISPPRKAFRSKAAWTALAATITHNTFTMAPRVVMMFTIRMKTHTSLAHKITPLKLPPGQ